MKLTKVPSFFNRTTFADADDPLVTFKGRLTAFDDATRDSLSTVRRIMATAPGTVIPASRAVSCGGEVWVVGGLVIDMVGDDHLRDKYIMHHATGKAVVRTFEEALLDAGGQTLWSSRLWVKASKEVDESSGEYEGYTMFFSRGVDLRAKDREYADGRESVVLVQLEGHWHLVRNSYTTAGGFLAAVVDELPGPVMTQAEFVVKTYDPKLDKDTSATLTVVAVNLRWQSYFTNLTQYADKYENGDSQLVVLKDGVTTKAGDKVSVMGRPYRVVSVVEEGACWSVHIRHA